MNDSSSLNFANDQYNNNNSANNSDPYGNNANRQNKMWNWFGNVVEKAKVN